MDNTSTNDAITAAAQSRVRALVERIEAVELEIADAQACRAEIYAEAKGEGYDVAALKTLVKRRREDAAKRGETETLVDLYTASMGAAA